MYRTSHRARSCHQRFHSGNPGPCCSPTHLCQVGTTSSDRTIEIQLPQTEITAEIQYRHPEPAVWRNQATPGTQHEPGQAVCREEVDSALKPVSTTTSDQQIGQTTDPEGRPRPQINPLVNLWLAPLPKISEVCFEAR